MSKFESDDLPNLSETAGECIKMRNKALWASATQVLAELIKGVEDPRAVYVTGGAVLCMLENKRISDFDVFVSPKDACIIRKNFDRLYRSPAARGHISSVSIREGHGRVEFQVSHDGRIVRVDLVIADDPSLEENVFKFPSIAQVWCSVPNMKHGIFRTTSAHLETRETGVLQLFRDTTLQWVDKTMQRYEFLKKLVTNGYGIIQSPTNEYAPDIDESAEGQTELSKPWQDVSDAWA